LWFAGIAIAVLAIVLVVIRAQDLREAQARTVSVHVVSTAGSHFSAADQATTSKAAIAACKATGGWWASLFDIRGPATVVVVASADSGSPRRITADCKRQIVTNVG
jgi:hypothetical protein